MPTTGDILKIEREKRNMSMGEFAEYLGVSKQNISMYESGKRSPKITIASKIASKLGLTISQLAGIEPLENDEMKKYKEKMESINSLIGQLNPENLDLASAFLEAMIKRQ